MLRIRLCLVITFVAKHGFERSNKISENSYNLNNNSSIKIMMYLSYFCVINVVNELKVGCHVVNELEIS